MQIEPVSGAGIGASLTVAAAPITVFFGADINALIIGLVVAFLFTIYSSKIDDKIKAGASVLLSSLFAGYGAPLAALVALSRYPEILPAGMETIRMFVAVVIGVTGPTIASAAVTALTRRAA